MFYLLKKLLLSTVAICFLITLHACRTDIQEERRKGKVFPGFSFSKAVAYDYDGSEKGDLVIEKGKIHPSVKKQVILSKEQTEELLAALNDTLSYGADITRCFKPHLGVVFYDENNIAKAQISICFLCNQHNSFPLIGAQENVKNASPARLQGYSDKGRKMLINFCQSLGFSNCSINYK
jgi:hypothetical protein